MECQPRSGIATFLDSVASITTIMTLPAPPLSAAFLDSSIYILHPTAPPSASILRLIMECVVSRMMLLPPETNNVLVVVDFYTHIEGTRICHA